MAHLHLDISRYSPFRAQFPEAQQKRIPARSVILVFQGKQLDESETLKSAGIEDLDKLYMITRTTGGMVR